MSSHYDTLGVSKHATPASIRQAYKQLLIRLHPDKRGGDAAGVARLERVRAAYATLIDAQKRALYDASLAPPLVVADTVTIDEFEHADDHVAMACRCGGQFALPLKDVNNFDVVPCDTCSLAVRIAQ